jgi:hypothetical protein
MTVYTCCDENRVDALRQRPDYNGIAYLEVEDDPSLPEQQRQRTLQVHMVHPLSAALAGALSKENVVIEGGDRLREIEVESVTAVAGDETVIVRVRSPGDFAPYTLTLVRDAHVDLPPEKVDPVLASVTFSFKVACPTDLDCKSETPCPPQLFDEPDIDYLAKDYASFRQLMLDRMSVLAPEWQERNPADVGVMLVELLAYVGDYLSYAQDAAATEAYLHTARRRVSVRRHARLLDYAVHEGANARAWVQIQTGIDGARVPAGTAVMTAAANQGALVDPNSEAFERATREGAVLFETMHDVRLYRAHNEISFYTWGDERCCLPAGATEATLAGALPDLAEGDVLILAEHRGPQTGSESDADPAHRHAVRLTAVEAEVDPLGAEGEDTPVTRITWAEADALPFALCVSARVESGDQAGSYDDVSLALGNVVLADHGLTLNKDESEVLDAVPESTMAWVPATPPAICESSEPDAVPPRYAPSLAEGPLTWAAPYGEVLFTLELDAMLEGELDAGTLPDRLSQAFEARRVDLDDAQPPRVREAGSRWTLSVGETVYELQRVSALEAEGGWHGACAMELAEDTGGTEGLLRVTALPTALDALETSPHDAMPAVCLREQSEANTDGDIWEPARDLLNSGDQGRHFVVEVESDGRAALRFGDDQFGKRPNSGTQFVPRYRTGNGRAGNVGADTLSHLVTDVQEPIDAVESALQDGIETPVRNPLAAQGGAAPESMEAVRQAAPVAFRTQERAVTPADYAERATQHAKVQRAEATMRWTGSWYTVSIAVDRLGGEPVDDDLERELTDYLEPYRMAGHDIEIDPPDPVPLELDMTVCVQPDVFRSTVRQQMLRTFTAGLQPDGEPGLFHPDRFTFGQTITLSPYIAAAQALDGVQWVQVTRFGRQDDPDPAPLNEQRLELGRLQVAQLENDPNYPKRGVFRLTVEGGK